MDDKYDCRGFDILDDDYREYIFNPNTEIIWDSLITMYVFLMNKFKFIKDKETINIFFYFYKMRYKILQDDRIYELINFDDNNTKLEKYLVLLIIIYNINTEILEFVDFLNKSKLFKLSKNNIYIDETNIYTDDIDNIKAIELILYDNIEIINNYLISYKIDTLNFFSLNEITLNIIKSELIERFKLLKKMFGSRLLNFLLNRKTRKKYSFIEIYDDNYLVLMKNSELIEYINKIFSRINNNIKKLKTDIEFNKYLQIIFINYIRNETKNQITKKFYNKLIKKYLIY